MKLSILIVNYNTDELTLEAVDSVIKFVKNIDYEIIVVDNNSSKKTKLSKSLENKQNTNFYQLNENIGFGRANNYACSKSKGDFIFLLNSDAYLIDNSLSGLVSFLEQGSNKIVCVGGQVLNKDLQPNIAFGNFHSIKKIKQDLSLKKKDKGFHLSRKVDFNTTKEVDYITGACLLIRRDFVEKYGLFNPKFFMFYEDMDLGYRIKKENFKSVINPNFKFVHIGGQSGLKNDFSNFKNSLVILKSKYLFCKNILPLGLNEIVYAAYLFQNYYAYSIFKLKKFYIKYIK